MKEIRIIVAGSRDFDDYKLLEENLDNYINDLVLEPEDRIKIISGTARGADILGERYASTRKYFVHRFPADWNRYGRRAGYLRNEKMAKYAAIENGVLFAFWNGESKGTKYMIDLAKRYGLEVHVILY